MNMDQFESQINLKVNKNDFDQMFVQLETLRELFKSSVVVLSESLSLHSARADETVLTK